MNSHRSTTNCLDGVPFSLHESIKRLKQIQLSFPQTKLGVHDLSEILHFNYDSTVEEKFVASREEERRKESELLDLQRQFQLFVEAQRSRLQQNVTIPTTLTDEEATTASSTVPSPLHQTTTTTKTILPTSVPLLPVDQPIVRNSSLVGVVGASNFPRRNIGDEILVPSRPSPKERTKVESKTGVNKIDLADFETEQDPFENLSLQVINDIEELDKVFLATNSASVPAGSQSHDLHHHHHHHHQQQQQPQQSLSTTRHLDAGYSNINSVIGPSDAVTSNGIAESKPVMGTWQSSITNPYSGYASFVQQDSVYPINSYGQLPVSQSAVGSNGSSHYQYFQQQQQMYIPQQHFNPQNDYLLNNISRNFYFNKYEGAATNSSLATNVAATEPEMLQQSSLRHAKSTPDITKLDISSENGHRKQLLDESPGQNIPNRLQNVNLYGRYTPPLQKAETGKMAGPTHFKVNLSSSSSSSSSASSSAAIHRHHLQHLYPKSSESHFVDRFIKLGFKGELVRKVILKFDQNEKKVLNYLTCIKNLVAKGHDPEVTEECLLHLDYMPDQVEKYITTFEIYHAMGFPAQKIHDTLKVTDMDQDKTLDILTGC